MKGKSILGAVQAFAALASGFSPVSSFFVGSKRERDKQSPQVHAERMKLAAQKRARKGLRRSSEIDRVEYHGKPIGFVGRHW